MKRNLGSLDKIARMASFIIIFCLFFLTDVIAGTLGIVLLAVTTVLMLTAFINFCPIYAILGINSIGKKKNTAAN